MCGRLSQGSDWNLRRLCLIRCPPEFDAWGLAIMATLGSKACATATRPTNQSQHLLCAETCHLCLGTVFADRLKNCRNNLLGPNLILANLELSISVAFSVPRCRRLRNPQARSGPASGC